MNSQAPGKFVPFTTIILFATFILFFMGSCQKQAGIGSNEKIALSGSTIVYTNVNPDSTVSSTAFSSSSNLSMTKNFNLDLNKDGIADFTFQIYFRLLSRVNTGSQSFVNVIPASGSVNQVENSNAYPGRLDTLVAIGSTLGKWSGTTNEILGEYNSHCTGGICSGVASGNWTSNAVKYLGLKLVKGSNTYYGWIRLAVYTGIPGTKLTILDYAYNSAPNQSILAGQTK